MFTIDLAIDNNIYMNLQHCKPHVNSKEKMNFNVIVWWHKTRNISTVRKHSLQNNSKHDHKETNKKVIKQYRTKINYKLGMSDIEKKYKP